MNEEKLTNDENAIRFENSTKEVNEEFAVTPCNFTVNIVDQNGNITKTRRYTNVNPSPFKNCEEAGADLAKKFNGILKS